MNISVATGVAPASIGNLGVGFDILGLSLEELNDQVVLKRRNDLKIHVEKIEGVDEDLPREPEKNTAGAALIEFQKDLQLKFGFDIFIKKGIPLSSGLGGSAASAVAATIAANEFLENKLSKENLLKYALVGEKVASGSEHLDNVAPSLLGGLCLCTGQESIPVIQLEFPETYSCNVFHPDVKIETKSARQVLSEKVDLKTAISQMQYLAGFVASVCRSRPQDMGFFLKDILIEPQRASLIPNFYDFKQAVLNVEGQLGFSISGAGPTMFAIGESFAVGEQIKSTFEETAKKVRLTGQSWNLKVNNRGAFTRDVH